MIVTAFFTSQNVPLISPGDVPEIDIWRLDTGASVVSGATMDEIGGGIFAYDFAAVDLSLEYAFRCDGDPNGLGQTSAQERYLAGSFSPVLENLVETTIRRLLDIEAGTMEIDTTTDPWQVVHYEDDAAPSEVQRYDLYDGDGNAINDANPLTDFVGRRVRA